jgi:hypothetical protein
MSTDSFMLAHCPSNESRRTATDALNSLLMPPNLPLTWPNARKDDRSRESRLIRDEEVCLLKLSTLSIIPLETLPLTVPENMVCNGLF